MRPLFILLSVPLFLLSLACQNKNLAVEQGKEDSFSDKLLGKWLMEARGGIDPPRNYNLLLESSGDYRLSVAFKLSRSPDSFETVASSSGRWHYSKSNDSTNIIALVDNQTNESTLYEVILTEDAMKLTEQGTKHPNIFSYYDFHRIKQ